MKLGELFEYYGMTKDEKLSAYFTLLVDKMSNMSKEELWFMAYAVIVAGAIMELCAKINDT